MDFRNVLMAIVLSTIVLIGWATFFEAPIVEKQTAENQITKGEDLSSPSIDEDEKGNIYDIRQKKNKKAFKEKIYYVSRFYRDNFISGRLIGIFREIVGNFKSNLKKRFLASKKFNQSFFTISKDKINLYKSTHIDRSMWTFDSKYSEKWEKNGLKKSSLYLKKLFELLENNNVNLINLYKYFDESDKETLIKKYFIPGDVHWNRAGHMLVFNALKKELSNIF